LLPERLTRVDETNRGQHCFLTEDDTCYYFGEYFAYKGYKAAYTNQLVLNLKIKPSILLRNPARRRHKETAITEVATALRKAISSESVSRFTWIPIPPSKTIAHPDYDDRLVRILEAAFSGMGADTRLLLRQTADTDGDHSGNRLSPNDLAAILSIDNQAAHSRDFRPGIALFDDVLTTGKHFTCCKQALRQTGYTGPIIGVFVARRILPDPLMDFEDLSDTE
jgi:hypothetical protein